MAPICSDLHLRWLLELYLYICKLALHPKLLQLVNIGQRAMEQLLKVLNSLRMVSLPLIECTELVLVLLPFLFAFCSAQTSLHHIDPCVIGLHHCIKEHRLKSFN